MKDEIKEKLDGLFETLENDLLSRSQYKLLLDYITNLQEENKMYAQLKDEYEDIIDKAIEKAIHIQETFGYVLDDLIFLLQGKSDE